MIEEGAFAGAKIDQVEFDTGFKNLTIYPNAFAGSSISNLEDFPYTGVTLMDNALAGMGNLKELSVRGDSREAGCYYIDESDDGLYGVGKDGKTTLYLVPAARRSADTYTITAAIVAPRAFSTNKSINTRHAGNTRYPDGYGAVWGGGCGGGGWCGGLRCGRTGGMGWCTGWRVVRSGCGGATGYAGGRCRTCRSGRNRGCG